MTSPSPIAHVLTPRPRDIGSFSVRRALPASACPTVGPFVFFDHMGPVDFGPGEGIDVRPHPHIGLATVTYLFEGEIVHRDSLGFEQPIRPGAVNWMVAGSGIVHSERTAADKRAGGERLHGIQTWIGLPQADEETAPSFVHHPADTLPEIEIGGATLRLIAGTAYGARAPVDTFSPIFYLDAAMPAGARLALPNEHAERAVYLVEGAAEAAGRKLSPGEMAVFAPGAEIEIAAHEPSRAMLLGGAPLDGRRHVWWNLVSSRKERIEAAKRDWKEGRFARVPGETEFIPLPED